MAYKYRNVKTGEVVTTTNRIGGKNWEPVEEKAVLSSQEDFVEAPAAEEAVEAPAAEEAVEAPVAEEAVEAPAEPPAEKPAAKSTRKGKK